MIISQHMPGQGGPRETARRERCQSGLSRHTGNNKSNNTHAAVKSGIEKASIVKWLSRAIVSNAAKLCSWPGNPSAFGQ